jgi:putative oxidoreductase
MSVPLSLTHSSPVRLGRAAFIALWAVQVGLAGMFLLAGGSKLLGAAPMVALFNVIGIGQWFRYVTGLIEVGSAVALLVPAVAVFGALALVPTMIGAILAQLFIVGDSAVPPAVLLVGVAVVIWARWDELPMRRPTVR